MDKLSASYGNGILTIQRDKYIKDGWYIENLGIVWSLMEIPKHGGRPQEIGNYPSFRAAYEKAKTLA